MKITTALVLLGVIAGNAHAVITFEPTISGSNYGYLIGESKTNDGTVQWSDSQAAHREADYAIGKYSYLYSTKGVDEVVSFPGTSLTISTSTPSHMQVRNLSLTINNFTLNSGTTENFIFNYSNGSPWPIKTQELHGDNWSIAGKLVLIPQFYWQRVVMAADLNGSGEVAIKIIADSSHTVGCNPQFVTAIPEFAGKISMYIEGTPVAADARALEFPNGDALGGPMPTETPDGVSMSDYCGLRPTSSMTMDVANRGICLSKGGFIETPLGVTFALGSPVRLVGGSGLDKNGEGTLALGSVVSFGATGTDAANGANNALRVNAGALKPLTVDATENLDITVAAGARLTVDAIPEDSGVAECGLCAHSISSQGDKLVVAIEGCEVGKEYDVALCTLPAAAATAVDGRLDVRVMDSVAADLLVVKKILPDGRIRFSAAFSVQERKLTVGQNGDGSLAPVEILPSDVGSYGVTLVKSGAVLAADGTIRTIATIAADVPELKAPDFTLEGFVPDGDNYPELVIDGEAGTVRTVKLVIRPSSSAILYSASAKWDDVGYLMGEKKSAAGTYIWSDHDSSHDNANYAVGMGAHISTTKDLQTEAAVFPGRSLLFHTDNAPYLEWRHLSFGIPQLTLAKGTPMTLYCYYTDAYPRRMTIGGSKWTIEGMLTIALQGAYFRATLAAGLNGGGQVTFQIPLMAGVSRYGQVIASTNLHYRGSVRMRYADGNPSESEAMPLEISHPFALGGELETFDYDSLMLEAHCGLKAMETMTLRTRNRGICIADGFFEVPANTTLSVVEPIRLTGGVGFYKKGAGTLALGGSVSFGASGDATGPNNALEIKEGALKPLSTEGVARLAVSFADGASLELDACPNDDGVAASGLLQPNGLAISGSKLPVKIMIPADVLFKEDAEVAICTVPSASAQSVADRLAVSCVGGQKRHRVYGLAVKPAGGDLSTVVATVGGPKGLAIIFR